MQKTALREAVFWLAYKCFGFWEYIKNVRGNDMEALPNPDRQLDERTSDGIRVGLWWVPGTETTYVTVYDKKTSLHHNVTVPQEPITPDDFGIFAESEVDDGGFPDACIIQFAKKPAKVPVAGVVDLTAYREARNGSGK